MILQIRTWPDPILLKSCESWNHDSPPMDYRDLEQNLFETLTSNGAIGLAANQVGYSFRVMLIHSQEYNEYITMYNPEVISTSTELWDHEEGCLSFPGIGLKIARSKTINVNWTDAQNNKYSRTFSKLDAKCVLHELDHLNGIVFKSYVSDLKFLLAKKKSKKR